MEVLSVDNDFSEAMVSLYRQYQKVLKGAKPSGKIMPYHWCELPSPTHVIWLPYHQMFEGFSMEISNVINAFTLNINRIRAWAVVVKELSDEQKMQVGHEFVDALATVSMEMPYAIRSKFIYATALLSHQANRTKPAWKDDFPADDKIYIKQAAEYGRHWRKFGKLKIALERLSNEEHRVNTEDFRNAYHHRFARRFVFGLSNVVNRKVDDKTGGISYGVGFAPAFELEAVAEELSKERDKCYRAFDAFQALIREQVAAIAASQL